MANNMMEVAKDFHEETGEKAKIAFDVGLFHGNIEDFLLAGQDLCRTLMSSYPKFFLKKVIEENRGITNFCTSRLLRLPPELSSEDSDFDKTLDSITERKIVDTVLEEKLRKILQNSQEVENQPIYR